MDESQERRIICLEGIVGSGKTTQVELLSERYGSDCYLIPELNEIYPMNEVRSELRKNGRISNLAREDVLKIIRARGNIHKRLLEDSDKNFVLMDRGIYTGMVFESGPLSMWEVESLSRAFGVVVPDICFVLYCSAEKALERVDERRVRVGKYSHRAFHENEDYINFTMKKYFEIAKHRPVILVETSGSKEEVNERIIGEIQNAGII